MQIANREIEEVNAAMRRFRYFDLCSFIFAFDSRQRTSYSQKEDDCVYLLCKTNPIYGVWGLKTGIEW